MHAFITADARPGRGTGMCVRCMSAMAMGGDSVHGVRIGRSISGRLSLRGDREAVRRQGAGRRKSRGSHIRDHGSPRWAPAIVQQHTPDGPVLLGGRREAVPRRRELAVRAVGGADLRDVARHRRALQHRLPLQHHSHFMPRVAEPRDVDLACSQWEPGARDLVRGGRGGAGGRGGCRGVPPQCGDGRLARDGSCSGTGGSVAACGARQQGAGVGGRRGATWRCRPLLRRRVPTWGAGFCVRGAVDTHAWRRKMLRLRAVARVQVRWCSHWRGLEAELASRMKQRRST